MGLAWGDDLALLRAGRCTSPDVRGGAGVLLNSGGSWAIAGQGRLPRGPEGVVGHHGRRALIAAGLVVAGLLSPVAAGSAGASGAPAKVRLGSAPDGPRRCRRGVRPHPRGHPQRGCRPPAPGSGRAHLLCPSGVDAGVGASTGTISARRSSWPASARPGRRSNRSSGPWSTPGLHPGRGEQQRSEHPGQGHGCPAVIGVRHRVPALPPGRREDRLRQHRRPPGRRVGGRRRPDGGRPR